MFEAGSGMNKLCTMANQEWEAVPAYDLFKVDQTCAEHWNRLSHLDHHQRPDGQTRSATPSTLSVPADIQEAITREPAASGYARLTSVYVLLPTMYALSALVLRHCGSLACQVVLGLDCSIAFGVHDLPCCLHLLSYGCSYNVTPADIQAAT